MSTTGTVTAERDTPLMISIPKNRGERGALAPLFDAIIYEESLIGGILNGDFGEVYVDRETDPNFAVIWGGDTTFIGGDPNAEGAQQAAKDFVGKTNNLVVAEDDWLPLVARYHRLLPFPTKVLEGSFMSLEEAVALQSTLPAGFSARRMSADDARKLEEDGRFRLDPWWRSPEHFYEEGFGYVVVRDEDGRPACSMHTGLLYKMRIKGYIQTHPDFRKQGLTRAVVGHFIEHCRTHGGYKSWWNTSSKHSEALALKLKFRPHGEYTVYRVRPRSATGRKSLTLKKRVKTP